MKLPILVFITLVRSIVYQLIDLPRTEDKVKEFKDLPAMYMCLLGYYDTLNTEYGLLIKKRAKEKESGKKHGGPGECTNKDLEEKLRVAEKEVQRVNAINQELIRSLHELKQGPSPYITTKTVKRTPALKDDRNRCWWSIVDCFRYEIAGCYGDKIYESISEKPFGNFIKETIDNNDEFSNAIERVESRRKMNVFERPAYQSYSAF